MTTLNSLASSFSSFVPLSKSRRWLLFSGAIALACVPPSTNEIPKVSPTSTLSPSEMALTNRAPFALVFAGPKGQALEDPSIQLVFSRPLRALGADIPTPEGLGLSPKIPGHWEWVGVHGLTFVPDGGTLPRATPITVHVPGSLRSLDGNELGEAQDFNFQTPVPRVLRASPGRWGNGQGASATIRLSFSQPVKAVDILPLFQAMAGTRRVPLVAKQGKLNTEVLFNASSGFPLDSKIDYQLSPGWVGQEGPASAVQKFTGEFRTHGPLVAEISCERDLQKRCRPGGSLGISLSNPVPALKFARGLFSPTVKLKPDLRWDSEDQTTYIHLNTDLSPGQRFTVSSRSGVRDIYGQALSGVKSATVLVGDYRPSVIIGLKGDSLIGDEKYLPVMSINTDYELTFVPLNGSSLQKLVASSNDERAKALAKLPGAHTRTIKRGKRNQRQSHNVDLIKLLKSQGGRGAFAIGVKYKNEDGSPRYSVRWGQKTDIGITAKRGRKQSSFWVTSLHTGKSISGAKVKVVGHFESASTNDNGIATLPSGQFVSKSDWQTRPEWIEVRHGDDVLYRSSANSFGGWRIPVDTDFYGENRDTAFLFPERDLFRPGESFRVKGYLRRPGLMGNQVLVDAKLTVVLESPDGEELQTKKVKTNSFGGYTAKLTIPRSSPTGYFTLKTRRSKETLTTATIQVANFRRAEFEVKVLPTAPAMIAGETARFDVAGNYFFGGVLSNASTNYRITREPTHFKPVGAEGLVVDDNAYHYSKRHHVGSGSTMTSTQGKLDELGALGVDTLLKLPGQWGPERIELDAEVTDISRQAHSGRGSLLVHQASYYLGLQRPKSYFVDAPGTFSPKVIALRPDGKRISGRGVTLSLERIGFTHVKQRSSDGTTSTVSEVVREFVGSCLVLTGKRMKGCGLKIPKSGYYILRASSKDNKGRQVHSSFSMYGLGNKGTSSWQDSDEQGTVNLKLDRDLYRVGDTARVLIQSPFKKANAWITIERDGVLHQRMQVVSGPAPSFEIKVDKKMRPNAFVSVHLIEDRQAMGKKAHAVSDSFRFGYVGLSVDRERQRLNVSVSADKDEYRPQGEVELKLTVKDANGSGRKAEVAIFVVDEGVLSLSGYTMPDPLKEFTKERPLRVETLEGRESIGYVFGLIPGDKANKGAPGGGGGEARGKNLTTAYFNPGVVTNQQGQASVRFKLPDNLGRFRVMALAVTGDDRYGKGSGALTVNKRLMVRPALPRFLRAGDKFQASAVISSKGMSAATVSVELSSEGIEIIGKSVKKVDIPQDGSVEVFFDAKVKTVGTAKIRFNVEGGGQRDAIALSRKIQSPNITEAVAVYGKTDTAEAHRLGDLTTLRSDLGGLDVTVSSTALVGLQGSFQQLYDYPYACTEQLSSRILPLMALTELSQTYGIDVPKNARAQIETGVAKILERQRGDGGFGLWPGSPESYPWVSAYALWVVKEATNRGVSVPAASMERGKRYLHKVAAQREQDDLPGATFAVFALTKLDEGDANTIHALFERRADMPVFSRFLLLWAAALEFKEKNNELVGTLLEELESTISIRGNRAEIADPHGEGMHWYMTSSARRHALAINGLLAARPSHALAAKLVRTLLDARKGGHWGNTQESAFALYALDSYRRAQEKEEPHFEARVFFAEKLLGKKTFDGRSVVAESFNTPMKKLTHGQDLIFQKLGSGSLFFEARLRYVRNELPKDPLESGFLVSKVMRKVTRSELAGSVPVAVDNSHFQAGDLVMVDVTVLAPEKRRFVVVDDPLPAGLEAIDMSLATSSKALSPSSGATGYASAWYRRELQDDRVLHFVDEMPAGIYLYRYLARATTKGSFLVPPTRAMEMYQEEVYGRTGARTVSIK